MRRALQIALILAGAVPLVLGIMNFLGGANAFWLPADMETPSVDNQLRFYAIWFTAPFFLCVWIARNLDRALPVATILFGVMFLGGLARAFSISQYGLPDPSMVIAMAVELGFVLFVPWIAYVTRSQRMAATASTA